MSAIDDAREAMVRARDAFDRTRVAREEARDVYDAAYRALCAAEQTERPVYAEMSVDALREHVADMARLHGSQCVDRGAIATTEAWRAFRAALAALAKRAT